MDRAINVSRHKISNSINITNIFTRLIRFLDKSGYGLVSENNGWIISDAISVTVSFDVDRACNRSKTSWAAMASSSRSSSLFSALYFRALT